MKYVGKGIDQDKVGASVFKRKLARIDIGLNVDVDWNEGIIFTEINISWIGFFA